MYSTTKRVNILVATFAALICVAYHTCQANTIEDCTSSCGNIHNITSPFRLNTDPKHCGLKKYQLSCENNLVILYLKAPRQRVVGFRVEAINYNNFTIRVSDPYVRLDNCGLPVVSPLAYHDLRTYLIKSPYSADKDWPYASNGSTVCRELIFISCPYRMNGSVHEVYNSPCYLKTHWYVKVVEFFFYDSENDVNSIENSCRAEATTVTSLLPHTAKNISYVDVKNSFVYGFELSWREACCISKVSTKYNCSSRYYLCQTDFTRDQWNRQKMTTGFDHLFTFLDNIKVTAFFSGMLASLNKSLDGQYDNDIFERLTIFGLIIHFLVAILAVLVLHRVLLCLLGPICVIGFLIYKWRRRHLSAYDNVERFLQSHENYLMPIRYTYSEIKKFTKNFKEKLGEGGYGSVYKAKLRSGRFAAIKMLDKSRADGQDFINEVATIGRIYHANVVRLIGFCVEGSKRALVYEFMDNGSLDKHIFFKEGGVSMNDRMIFDICLGVAHGIEYLHQGCNMQILHFDIKPHNILLDEKFIPKISDFGLAKLHSTDHSIMSLTAIRGTMGYIAPEFFYKNIGGISYKADVYSFGMLLMEMVGRRKNVNAFTEHSSRIYFPSWVYDQFGKGKELKLGDETKEVNDMVKKMIIVALWCIQLNPVNRPSMRKVIEMLEEEIEHLKMPPKPFVAPQETPENDAGLDTNSSMSPLGASSDYSTSISLLVN